MAERFNQLQQSHCDFIARQHLFFVGTAAGLGSVNVSPKGMDSFRVIDPGRVVWLNLTGSGNESAAHVRENPRMTVMFCSFDKQPLILRLYGQATVVHPRDQDWSRLAGLFPDHPGARQFFEIELDLVQTSCGYAVPQYTFDSDRPTLKKWAQKHSADGIEDYWREKNLHSLDGFDTGIFSAPENE